MYEDQQMHGSSELFREALERHERGYIAGLDVSLTNTGVYLKSLNPSEEAPDWHYYIPTSPKKHTDSERVDHIVQTVTEDFANPLYPVIAVCIEDYGPINKFAGKITVRAEAIGCIKRFMRNAGIPYYTVSPTGLKKWATGFGGTVKGEGNKDAVIRCAAVAGFETRISDEADAFHAANLMHAIVKNEKHGISVERTNPAGYSFTKKY